MGLWLCMGMLLFTKVQIRFVFDDSFVSLFFHEKLCCRYSL